MVNKIVKVDDAYEKTIIQLLSAGIVLIIGAALFSEIRVKKKFIMLIQLPEEKKDLVVGLFKENLQRVCSCVHCNGYTEINIITGE